MVKDNTLISTCPQCLKGRSVTYSRYMYILKYGGTCRRCALNNQIKYHCNDDGFYNRNCPLCKKVLSYRSASSLRDSIKNNCLCYSCSNKIKTDKLKIAPDQNGKYSRLCPQCNKTIYHTRGDKRNSAEKAIRLCRTCSNINSSKNPEVKEKIRIKFKERSKDKIGQFVPSYNPRACLFFNIINTSMGWSGVHAENGGEFIVSGYFLDFYEPNLNIVIEFDESHHNETRQKSLDEKRQNQIITTINCKFYRFKEGSDINKFINDLKTYDSTRHT